MEAGVASRLELGRGSGPVSLNVRELLMSKATEKPIMNMNDEQSEATFNGTMAGIEYGWIAVILMMPVWHWLKKRTKAKSDKPKSN